CRWNDRRREEAPDTSAFRVDAELGGESGDPGDVVGGVPDRRRGEGSRARGTGGARDPAKQLGVGERGIKTDERDAQVLIQGSCRIDLPSVHIPSLQARELRSIIRSREMLVGTRTKTINHVRGWLRTQLWRIRTGSTKSFTDRVRGRATELGDQIPMHIEQVL